MKGTSTYGWMSLDNLRTSPNTSFTDCSDESHRD
ncbi:hypothetical protein H4W81_002737 [Nonomuraea africana]|uniref:Uncharacterized protein n=1 Tax=Nonomuraea africana TaxID=46171 RepID=A0ABR9KD58_9ACTN|nr:hypothetical protein [Nonomuraea africana]